MPRRRFLHRQSLTPVAACAGSLGITKQMIGLGISKYGIEPIQFK